MTTNTTAAKTAATEPSIEEIAKGLVEAKPQIEAAAKKSAARSAAKKAAAAPAAKKAPAKKVRAYKVPKGYEVKWQHGGHDLLAKTDAAVKGPKWYTACNEHGDLHEAASAKEAEQVGALAQRSVWCKGDHAAKPAAKKAPAKKAPAKAAAKPAAKKAPATRTRKAAAPKATAPAPASK